MICPKCGTTLNDGSEYCFNCGVVFSAEAPNAQTQNANPENRQENFQNFDYGNTYQNENMYASQNPGMNGGTVPPYANFQSGNMPPYGNPQQGNFYSNGYNNGNFQPPYNAPMVNNSAPSVKDYLKWMLAFPLLALIPGVGTILLIILAILRATDKTNVGRANYFKAYLITYAITMVVGIFIAVVFFAVMTFAGVAFSDAMPEIFEEFAYEFMSIMR